MNGDDITILHAEVMSNNTVDSGTSVIKVIICQHDQHCIPSHLALDQDSVSTEETESLHRVIGEGDDGIIIIDGIGDAEIDVKLTDNQRLQRCATHINELGFFFFLRMAVDVSSS